jgi:S-adenosylmethionine hydrolase
MPIITLTTDMGMKDHYVAAIKGAILSQIDPIQIIDITHEIQSFSILHATFVLQNCFEEFPKGTIHIMGVNSEPMINLMDDTLSSYPAIMKYKDHYFISNDNGFFSLLVGENEHQGFWRIDDVLSSKNVFKFPTKNILVPAACKIASGIDITTFCSEHSEFQRAITFQPVFEENLIKGNVVHIDHFGNLITNISKSDFSKFDKEIPFTIFFRRKEYFIDTISISYSDVPKGEKVAIFNSNDFLEIALNQGATDRRNSAAALFGMSVNDIVRIEFTPRGSKDTLESLFI